MLKVLCWLLLGFVPQPNLHDLRLWRSERAIALFAILEKTNRDRTYDSFT
ncbi:hypothetical protein QQ054_01860 [Oscillatoria amoena NRMC-F 0135]|nr:hypothetical protein [Oscillatoria amoena NRMC-F 0135]